ncbi:MAG: metallophosphoesterase family protein [Chloroflexales bacterium]|nr:metallophosphoesterase family protein [Chloroflexales bacterium]
MTLAIIADIHGNSWALDAVLTDLARRGVTQIVNLGDCAYGSLDPAGTLERLIARGIPTVSGNQDRIVHTPPPAVRGSADDQFINARITTAQRTWLQALPPSLGIDEVFCCHGTPESDETYLLEEVTSHGVRLRDDGALRGLLAGVAQPVIVCGHSHVPRVVLLSDGRLVVNPGSVGIPAYTEDLPHPHVMEAGSPHARYALLRPDGAGWDVELIALPYAWAAAAEVARHHGRPDRATWLATGRAQRG